MKRKKVMCVFGTRPEAIKMAPVIAELRSRAGKIEAVVCVTAQHREMLDDVLRVFRIRPRHDLDIMKEGQSLEHITRLVIERVPPVLRKERPDLVLVHGDTSTTFLTALACFYQKIPVGHVEAGLRSYNFQHPFPEEANRRLGDDLCALHFAATPQARTNLVRENISPKGIFITGNTVIDALQWAVRRGRSFEDPALRKLFRSSGGGGRLILVTAHRRENFGAPFQNVFRALRRIADEFGDARIVYPVHPNPNVRAPARAILSGHPRITLLEPLSYLDVAHLIRRCSFVVTDSGGLQEEAPSLGKPVLVLRQVTERPEAVRAGTARVIGTDESRVYQQIRSLLTDSRLYRRMANAVNPYGDGQAARRTVQAILHFFGLGPRPRDFRSN